MALRWLSLVGAIWLQSINGTNSNFPAYSSQLKHLLSLSQLQLNNLAFASDAGKLFGWFSGLAALYLPLPVVLILGSLLGLVGYGIQYLFLTHHISSLSYPQVFLLTALAGNSICWINTVCYIVTIKNFPLDTHLAVGISTSYFGLSAKIYTDIVDSFFQSSPSERAKAYLLLNSILPLVVCVLVSPIVRYVNVGKSRRMEGGFLVMFLITMGTGIFAVITSVSSISKHLSQWIIVLGTGVFLLVPVVVPFAEKIIERSQNKCWLRRERRVHDVSVDEEVGVVVEEDGVVKEREGSTSTEGNNIDHSVVVSHEEEEVKSSSSSSVPVLVLEEVGVKLMLRKVEFWLYFFVYLCGATLGLVYLNNLGQISESRGYSKTASLVSLSSSFGFFGRLVPSLMIYIFSRYKCMASSRSAASIAALMAPMSGAFFLLLINTNISLFISTAIIGACTGAITSIAVSTTTELFGTKNFSVNHNIVVANIPIGSFVFGDLAALVYRRQSDASDGSCMGMACYQTTFIIWGSLCFFGCFLALILHVRTKK